MLTYRKVGIGASALYGTLFAVLLAAPEAILWLFALEPAPAATVLARRAALLFLALAITAWTMKDAPPSPARSGWSLANIVGLLGLAALGAIELARGQVGLGVTWAMAGELAFAVAFIGTRNRA